MKKIRESKYKYDERRIEYDRQLADVTRYNKQVDAEYDSQYKRKHDIYKNWYQKEIAPLLEEQEYLWAQLESRQTGFLGNLFGYTRRYPPQGYFRGKKLTLDYENETQDIIDKFEDTFRDINRKRERFAPDLEVDRPTHKTYPKRLQSNQFFTMLGTKVRIDLYSLDLEKIESIISQRELEEDEKKEKITHLKARASENAKETRQQARKYQKDLTKQKELFSGCPYCGESLDDSKTHLDHIYPVSKGGQSIKRNLVFVCVECNLQKGNQTLRSFILSVGLKESVVYKRLEKLNKDF